MRNVIVRNVKKIETDDRNMITVLLKEVGVKLLEAVERSQIVKAMGMGLGHWFKCPNGHVYAIGECGGATWGSFFLSL